MQVSVGAGARRPSGANGTFCEPDSREALGTEWGKEGELLVRYLVLLLLPLNHISSFFVRKFTTSIVQGKTMCSDPVVWESVLRFLMNRAICKP